MSDPREVRVVVVGDEKCGKTTFITRFISNQVPEIYKPTGFDKFFTSKLLESEDPRYPHDPVVDFTVWDTSGSTSYDSVRPLSYTEADVFIVCFRISDPISLYNVKAHWIGEIRKHSQSPVVLCGCMSDLRSDPGTVAHLAKIGRSPVTVEQALSSSSQIGACGYVETRSLVSYVETYDTFRLAAGTVFDHTAERSPLEQRMYEPRLMADPSLNVSKSSFSGSHSSISNSVKNFDEGYSADLPVGPHNVSHTILEHDVFENPVVVPPARFPKPQSHSPLTVGRPHSPLTRSYSPASLPTSPLSLPTSPSKPSRTNPTSPQDNNLANNSVHCRSVSQPVVLRSNLDNQKLHWRGEEDPNIPPLLPQRAPSPPPRPNKSLQTRTNSSSSMLVNQPPPEMRSHPQNPLQPQHHNLSRKNSFRTSLPVSGKPPLPHSQSLLPKSPTDLLSLSSQQSPITSEPAPVLLSSRSRLLNQLGVQSQSGEHTGKNYESLKSHTSTASHGSTGSKLSTASSAGQMYNGPRDLDIPDTEDPELLANLDFVSPKAGVYRPVNGPGGRSAKKDKCSLM